MIVRTLPDGAVAVMGQTDHSRFVGQVAAHWGNERFERPRPYGSVVRGATFHDFGWLTAETRPAFNKETGKPYQFFETPFNPSSMTAYQECIDWLTAIDPYSGLLIGKHRTGLYQGRYGTLTKPAAQYSANGPAMRPEIRQFVDANESAQAKLAKDFDPAEVQINYRLLQVWDQMGLYFCCRSPQESALAPVPTTYGTSDGEGIEMQLHPISEFEVKLDPYPLDIHPLQLQIGYRRLPPDATYAGEAEWLQAYFSAPLALMTYTVS